MLSSANLAVHAICQPSSGGEAMNWLARLVSVHAAHHGSTIPIISGGEHNGCTATRAVLDACGLREHGGELVADARSREHALVPRGEMRHFIRHRYAHNPGVADGDKRRRVRHA